MYVSKGCSNCVSHVHDGFVGFVVEVDAQVEESIYLKFEVHE